MRKMLFLLLAFFVTVSGSNGQSTKKEKGPAEKIQQYWFVMIRKGPKQDFDSTAKAKLLDGHMANIIRLYYDGILKVAGPFGKNDLEWSGIFVLDYKTKEEAEQYVSNDPTIAARLFAVDIVPWYSEPTGSFKKGILEKLKENL